MLLFKCNIHYAITYYVIDITGILHITLLLLGNCNILYYILYYILPHPCLKPFDYFLHLLRLGTDMIARLVEAVSSCPVQSLGVNKTACGARFSRDNSSKPFEYTPVELQIFRVLSE